MISDEKLKIAAKSAAEYLAFSIPDGVCEDHVYSPGFERAIQEICNYWKKHKPNKAKKIIKWILIAAAVIIIAFGVLVAASPEIRATVAGWFRDTFGIYITYEHDGNSSIDEEISYELTWVPEGYELEKQVKTDSSVDTIYINDNNDRLFFSCFSANAGNKVFIDPESAVSKEIRINGTNGEILIAEDENESNMIIWNDTEKDILFTIMANEDEEILIKMAEHVEAVY